MWIAVPRFFYGIMKTKENPRILSFCVALVCAISFKAQTLNVTEVPANESAYKTSRAQRFDHIKEVI